MLYPLTTDFGGGEIGVLLRNSYFARRPDVAMFFTPNWSVIRVALRMMLPASSTAVNYRSGTPRFAVGLCAGEANIMGEDSTDNFVGCITDAATWPYPGSSSARQTIASIAAAKKVGSSLTVGTSLTAGTVFNVGVWKLFFVDITRGSPNYTIALSLFPNANSTTSVTKADFDTQSVAAVPALANHGTSAGQTIAVNEGTGTFSHGCVAFDKNWPYVNLADFSVHRVS